MVVHSRQLFPDLWPEPRGSYKSELAVGIVIGGKEIADIRKGGYKGEWGTNPTKKIFGEKIKPIRFTDFEYNGAQLIIPVDAWDTDLEGPPEMDRSELDTLHKRGEEIIKRISEYIANFAKEFEKIDASKALNESK